MFSGDAAWQDRSHERLGEESGDSTTVICVETCSTGKEVSEALGSTENQRKVPKLMKRFFSQPLKSTIASCAFIWEKTSECQQISSSTNSVVTTTEL